MNRPARPISTNVYSKQVGISYHWTAPLSQRTGGKKFRPLKQGANRLPLLAAPGIGYHRLKKKASYGIIKTDKGHEYRTICVSLIRAWETAFFLLLLMPFFIY